jgi:Response regulator with putative antiterminator output domain
MAMAYLDNEEDLKIINKAKKHIMHKYRMSEADAHVFIQQTAMRNRMRKLKVAKIILEKANA